MDKKQARKFLNLGLYNKYDHGVISFFFLSKKESILRQTMSEEEKTLQLKRLDEALACLENPDSPDEQPPVPTSSSAALIFDRRKPEDAGPKKVPSNFLETNLVLKALAKIWNNEHGEQLSDEAVAHKLPPPVFLTWVILYLSLSPIDQQDLFGKLSSKLNLSFDQFSLEIEKLKEIITKTDLEKLGLSFEFIFSPEIMEIFKKSLPQDLIKALKDFFKTGSMSLKVGTQYHFKAPWDLKREIDRNTNTTFAKASFSSHGNNNPEFYENDGKHLAVKLPGKNGETAVLLSSPNAPPWGDGWKKIRDRDIKDLIESNGKYDLPVYSQRIKGPDTDTLCTVYFREFLTNVSVAMPASSDTLYQYFPQYGIASTPETKEMSGSIDVVSQSSLDMSSLGAFYRASQDYETRSMPPEIPCLIFGLDGKPFTVTLLKGNEVITTIVIKDPSKLDKSKSVSYDPSTLQRLPAMKFFIVPDSSSQYSVESLKPRF